MDLGLSEANRLLFIASLLGSVCSKFVCGFPVPVSAAIDVLDGQIGGKLKWR